VNMRAARANTVNAFFMTTPPPVEAGT
jgi:hypothetical protein